MLNNTLGAGTSTSSASQEGKHEGKAEGKLEGKDEGKAGEESKSTDVDPPTRIATRGPYVHDSSTVSHQQTPPTGQERTADMMELDYQFFKWIGVHYIARIKDDSTQIYHSRFDNLISVMANWMTVNRSNATSSSADNTGPGARSRYLHRLALVKHVLSLNLLHIVT